MDEELIKRIQRFVGVKDDGDIGPNTLKAIADKLGIKEESNSLIEIALKDVGIYETSKNNGIGIAKYWTATDYEDGYKLRAPYCAAAVCYWIKESNLFSEENRPKTAAAFGFEKWAKRIGLSVTKNPTEIKKGMIVVFNFSHVGIAISDSDSKGNFSTVEANTSQGQSGSQRDGGGVWKRSRNIRVIRSSINLG